MDGAEAGRLYATIVAKVSASTSRRAWGCRADYGVNRSETAPSAYLYGGIKYSNENFED